MALVMFFSKVGRSFVVETEWRKTLTAGAFAIFMNWLVKLTHECGNLILEKSSTTLPAVTYGGVPRLTALTWT